MKLVTPHRGGVQRDQDRRVRAELMTSSEEERAMPPDDFNAGAIGQLGTAANAVLVDMRANPAPSEHVGRSSLSNSLPPVEIAPSLPTARASAV